MTKTNNNTFGNTLGSPFRQPFDAAGGGGGAGTEWDGLEVGYDFNGDNEERKLDVLGVHNLSLYNGVALEPTTYVGPGGGGAIGALDQVSTYAYETVKTSSIFRGPEATIICWFYDMTTNTGPWSVIGTGGSACTTYSLHHVPYIRYVPNYMPSITPIRNVWTMETSRFGAAGMDLSFNAGTPYADPRLAPFATATCELWMLANGNTRGGCRIAYFRLFNRWLTDEEVTTHYNAGAGLPYPG